MIQLRDWQLSLRELLTIVLFVSLGSCILECYNPPLRLTEVGRYQITVDYSRSLKEMIAVGRYDDVNSRITSANFPIKAGKAGREKLEAIIVNVDRSVTGGMEEALKAIDRKGWRPGTLAELLALGEQYPELPGDDYIYALGSWDQGVKGGCPTVALLVSSVRHHLWLGSVGDKSDCYLVFRK